MSHKHKWRGLVAAAAFLLTAPPAFSQEPTVIQMTNDAAPEDNLMVLNSPVSVPAPGLFASVGEFNATPGCPIPFSGRPPLPPMPPGGPHFGVAFAMPLPPLANIELADDQISRLAKLKRAFETGNSTAFSTLRSLEDDMRDKLSAENINESDVKKLAEEIAQQKADISKRFSAHILESAKILTPEQRKKIRLTQDKMELGPLGGPPTMPPYPPIPEK